MQAWFSKAREIAHSAVAVIAGIAGAQGVIVTLLATFGVHIDALVLSQEVGAAGVAAGLISKAIDSLNDAAKAGLPVSVTQQSTPLHPVVGAPAGSTQMPSA